jgi:NADP-dependent 3-hydroxy acid dehydrogenase YdfG
MIPSDCLAPGLLRGKTAFVTGGGSGINLAIAKAFARAGADVAICGRTAEKLESARTELEALGAKVSTAVADVRDEDAMGAALEQAQRQLAPVDAGSAAPRATSWPRPRR